MQKQEDYRATCTLKRKGGTVTDVATGMVVCNGMENIRTYPWCEGVIGSNAAKRFIRKSGAVSYSV